MTILYCEYEMAHYKLCIAALNLQKKKNSLMIIQSSKLAVS